MGLIAAPPPREKTIMPRPSAKGKLLDTAMNQFHANGYRGCTIESICEETGVVKGSFYNSFDSKEALAIEVIKLYGKIEETVCMEGPPSAARRLREHFEFLERCYDRFMPKRGCLLGNFSSRNLRVASCYPQSTSRRL
jgi:TetR/AcrR family transcriptional regulator, transcriptional repressor for nem operon